MGFFSELLESAATTLPGNFYGTTTREQQVLIDGVCAILQADGDCTLAEMNIAARMLSELFRRSEDDLDRAIAGRALLLAGLDTDEVLAGIAGDIVDRRTGGLALVAGMTATIAMNGHERKGFVLERREEDAARKLATLVGVVDKFEEAKAEAETLAPQLLELVRKDPWTPT